jgi:hypothetical protein
MSNVLVYVQTTSTGFQWGFSTNNMVPLSTTLVQRSSGQVTFEFLRVGTTLYFKLPPSTPTGRELPTTNGPTAAVTSGDSASISFSNSSGGTYYAGSVTVSSDDFVGGGDDS